MLTLFRDGGYPMFFIVLVGFAGLAASAWYAFRPTPRRLGFIAWMGLSLMFAIFQGTCADAGAVLSHVARMDPVVNPAPILIEGLAESTSPGILGFAFLALIGLMTAVGRARDTRAG